MHPTMMPELVGEQRLELPALDRRDEHQDRSAEDERRRGEREVHRPVEQEPDQRDRRVDPSGAERDEEQQRRGEQEQRAVRTPPHRRRSRRRTTWVPPVASPPRATTVTPPALRTRRRAAALSRMSPDTELVPR
jgi:hypothetical protein